MEGCGVFFVKPFQRKFYKEAIIFRKKDILNYFPNVNANSFDGIDFDSFQNQNRINKILKKYLDKNFQKFLRSCFQWVITRYKRFDILIQRLVLM